MKTRIRTLALVLVFLLALPLSGGIADAADISTSEGLGQTVTKTQLETTAIEYVNRYVETAFCYKEVDFAEKTLLSLVSESKLSTASVGNSTLTLRGVTHTLSDLYGNLRQFEGVADYYKTTRQANGMARYNFNADYSILETVISDTTAYVKLYALVTFQYTVGGEVAAFGDNYVVHFAKYNNNWCIVNVEAEEFESYSLTKEEFDYEKATQQFLTTAQLRSKQAEPEAQLVYEPINMDLEVTSTRTVQNRRYYNRNNATAYAYTYTTQSYTGDGNHQDFLNDNFGNYTADGNCQNFVSQCVWAGFNGSDDPNYIGGSHFPMDQWGLAFQDDRESLHWYYTSGADREHWTAPYSFRDYIDASNSAAYSDTTGIGATVYSIPAGSTSFSAVTGATALIGGVLHVMGERHAVIITGATSKDFSGVTICENSPMRKAVCLRDQTAYTEGAMELILPQYFNIANNCSGHSYASYSTGISPSGRGSVCQSCGYESLTVYGNMIKPIPAGTTASIIANASMLCYRISIGVAPPDPNNPGSNLTTSWTNYSNVGNTSRSYTFSTPGLYIIRIVAHDISITNSNSHSVTHVFKVRVY